MTSIIDWEVIIETGPTAADCHCIVVSGNTANDALKEAQKWAKNNGYFDKAHYSAPKRLQHIGKVPVLDNDYTDIVEWTAEEEEAFLNILNRPT